MPIPTRTRGENIADVILFICITAPAAFLMLTSVACSGWNEGTMAGACVNTALDGFYNALMGAILLFAFSGAGLLFLPVLIVAAPLSIARKINRYVRGGLPRASKEVTIELVAWLPLLGIAWLVLTTFVH